MLVVKSFLIEAMIRLFYTVNTVAADELATQGWDTTG